MDGREITRRFPRRVDLVGCILFMAYKISQNHQRKGMPVIKKLLYAAVLDHHLGSRCTPTTFTAMAAHSRRVQRTVWCTSGPLRIRPDA